MNKIELGWQYGPVCTFQLNFLLTALYDLVHWFQCINGTAFFIIAPKISKVLNTILPKACGNQWHLGISEQTFWY